jgi:hypothetical protein
MVEWRTDASRMTDPHDPDRDRTGQGVAALMKRATVPQLYEATGRSVWCLTTDRHISMQDPWGSSGASRPDKLTIEWLARARRAGV